ncbi:cell shape determination protein CcmA [Brevibacillus sp. SYP-B805]|nr:cell shape determination protein CcmA [Brevibacillus sp. SYP-B805]
MKEKTNDLRINGMGTASGGRYDRVDINGVSGVNGDLECQDFNANGKVKINGAIRSGTVYVEGLSTVKGNVQAQRINIHGKMEIEGDVTFQEIRVDGKTRVSGRASGEEADIRGNFHVEGDCDAEVFSLQGGFTVGGLLNAGKIEIHIHDGCQAKEIGGEHIRVRKIAHGPKFWGALLPFGHYLTTDSVEGDDIHLEYTKARVVRGNNVTIGPGCEIDLVEYRGQYRLDQGAKVGESRQL